MRELIFPGEARIQVGSVLWPIVGDDHFGNTVSGEDTLGMSNNFLSGWSLQSCELYEPRVIVNDEKKSALLPLEKVCGHFLPGKHR